MKNTGVWSYQEALKNHVHSKDLAVLMGELFYGQKVLDLGCGTGFYTDYLNSIGIDTIGVDGTEFPEKKHIVWDLSTPMPEDYVKEKRQIICLEVAEHIPSIYENIVIENIVKFSKNKIILSWAFPSQGGYGHVNERPPQYVIKKMEEHNFTLNENETNNFRKKIEKDKCWWYKKSLYIFETK